MSLSDAFSGCSFPVNAYFNIKTDGGSKMSGSAEVEATWNSLQKNSLLKQNGSHKTSDQAAEVIVASQQLDAFRFQVFQDIPKFFTMGTYP